MRSCLSAGCPFGGTSCCRERPSSKAALADFQLRPSENLTRSVISGEYGDELGRRSLWYHGPSQGDLKLITGSSRHASKKQACKALQNSSLGFRLNPGDVVGEGGALGIAPTRGATVRAPRRRRGQECSVKTSRRVSLYVTACPPNTRSGLARHAGARREAAWHLHSKALEPFLRFLQCCRAQGKG